MAGKPGKGGPVPQNIREYAESTIREVALPKMRAYLQKSGVTAEHWKWVHTELCRLAGLNAATGENEGSQERNLRMLA